MEAEQKATELMTPQEAQEKDAQIIKLSGDYIDMVGPIALEMRKREGWRALGFKNWTDYCKHVDKRISAVNVMRLAQKAEIEQNVQARLPMRHALVLAKIDNPEGQHEVHEMVTRSFQKPVEQNYEAYVARWLREHEPDARRAGRNSDKDGWTKGDLEADSELSDALDVIEKVYGFSDRKAIQTATVPMPRKDVIALSKFHPTKMREYRDLLVGHHWKLERVIKFLNKTIDGQDTVGHLINRCLSTPDLYFTCAVSGYDISVKASPAVAKRIKELRQQPSVKSRVTSVTTW